MQVQSFRQKISYLHIASRLTPIKPAEAENLLFRQVMDWDIERTAFREYVTIGGTATAKNVVYAGDNGFASSNSLSRSFRYLFSVKT